MGKLHELLAVESDIENVYKKIMAEAQTTFTKKPAHFMGFHKRLNMFSENENAAPEEMQDITETVDSKLSYISMHGERYPDAVLQKEATNQTATADLVVEGKTIAEKVPATFLLGLENKLKYIRAVYEAIPTLPPGYSWERDETKGVGVWKIKTPEQKFKTAKTFKHKVLYQATKEHPAQIERWEEMENVGMYVMERWFGMFSPAQKSEVLGRIDTLLRATKKARQKANSVNVVKNNIGGKIFDYINKV